MDLSMDLSSVALWGNLAALAVTIGLLGATLRLGRSQPRRAPAATATATGTARYGIDPKIREQP